MSRAPYTHPRSVTSHVRPPGGRALSQPATPGAYRTGANPLPVQFRGLVGWVAHNRDLSLRFGWCRKDPAYMRSGVDKLLHWVNTNPTPSVATALEYWREHENLIRVVAPGNIAGRARLRTMELLIDRMRHDTCP